jgi:biotin carboxyl carrier protein
MHGRIEMSGEHYDVTVFGHVPDQLIQIGQSQPQAGFLDVKESGDCTIHLGQKQARIRMHIKGETAFIRAFERSFVLKVINPVEQARLATGAMSREARAPMPGVVVDVHVVEGEHIVKGQLMMTIESMKILTAILAPLEGKVEKIHFSENQPFEKGTVLVTLGQKGK